jgi:hypothetical protein
MHSDISFPAAFRVVNHIHGWNMRIQLFDICLVVVDMFKRLCLLGKASFIDDPAAFLLRENNYENSGSIVFWKSSPFPSKTELDRMCGET